MEQFLQLDFEIDWTRANHVLNFEIRKFDLVANLRNGFGVVLGSIQTQLFTLGSGNDHLSSFEYQSSSSGRFFHTHDHSSKSLWIVLSISTFERNIFQVQGTAQTGSRNEILKLGWLVFSHLGLGLRTWDHTPLSSYNLLTWRNHSRVYVILHVESCGLDARLLNKRLLAFEKGLHASHWTHWHTNNLIWESSSHRCLTLVNIVWRLSDIHLVFWVGHILINAPARSSFGTWHRLVV